MIAEEQSWLAEAPMRGFQQRFEVSNHLQSQRTSFQQLDIYQSRSLGRVLVLDGALQTSELDEFIYHEMLTLVPLLTHPNPRRVAIIGGGDGGTLRRVLGFDSIQRAVQIEIDEQVTNSCRAFLPSIARGAFEDPRAELLFVDGFEFLRQTTEVFDVVLVDSTDPIGAAEVLFSKGFYELVNARLADDGVLATQSGSPLLMLDELVVARSQLGAVLGEPMTYLASIPAYPGVLWSFTMASKGRRPLDVGATEISARLKGYREQVRYYGPEVHTACFALPGFIRDSLVGGASFGLFPS